jgi:signal transduction histidine kinase
VNTRQTEWVLQLAGLILWAVVGFPVVVRLAEGSAQPGDVGWLLIHLAWGAAFAWASSARIAPRVGTRALLALQTVGGLVLILADNGVSEPALLSVVAAQLPFVLRPGPAFVWVVVQTIALGVILAGHVPAWAAHATGMFSLQLFAFGAGHLAASESRARCELAIANAELRANRDLMAESSRLGERLRIARELHDTLGHHLTALSLNLEVASHVATGKAAEHVDKAHALTRLLLAEVRDVVGPLREPSPLDVAGALRTLAAAIPTPAVHLDLRGDLAVDDPVVAQAVVRCVQEAMTNAIRHAAARNLWIEVARDQGELRVRARDDGRGVSGVRPGNGLRGMRERVEEVGGRLELESQSGHGFEVRARVPVTASLAS